MTRRSRVPVFVAASLLMLSPLATSSTYLWLWAQLGDVPGWVNTAALAAILCIGLLGIGMLPIARWLRLAIGPVYVAAMFFGVLAWSAIFLCSGLNRCF